MTREKMMLKKMHQHAADIFYSGLKNVNPGDCIQKACRLEQNILSIQDTTYDLDNFNKLFVIGAGKAGASMASAIEHLFGNKIDKGLIITKYGHAKALKRIELFEAGHPLPDNNGLTAAKKIHCIAEQADENTLVICLISGGASALMTLPVKGITLDDKQKTTRLLLNCGATIHEINTIRKHLSQIKGGLLAKAAFPAALLCLMVSDVVGDDLDIIGSGPAAPDSSTFRQCCDILEFYNIKHHIPKPVLNHLNKGARNLIPDTPKKGNPIFDKISTFILANNTMALSGAHKKAAQLGYTPLILSAAIEGETRDVAIVHAAIARQILTSGHPVKPPACLLSGGETTVTIKGDGKGGRNQEFALASAFKIQGLKNVVILSAGTDGTDGPTDAAGAFADQTTIQRAMILGLNPRQFLDSNNSYPFFNKLSDLFRTGATNTNVMDLRIILIR